MLIQGTNKLLDELKIAPAEQFEEENPIVSWHANTMKIGRHKFMVLVNNKNRYAIVLYGLKAKDKKNIGPVIENAIREVFQSESMKDEVIEEYLKASSDYTFTKTKDRKQVARLNKACEAVYFGEDYLDMSSIVQVEMSKWISSTLVGDGKNSYFNPNEMMYKDLSDLTSQPVFHTDALQLKVTLELDHHSVWRRIRVPVNVTFPQLHNVL
ncbi:plasmid pRiA4b ORF-3 family protein [Bacillus sp. RO3]|nr:plasmid pRiA4b ORF-3 family protein [Bacillus sp. RO3]